MKKLIILLSLCLMGCFNSNTSIPEDDKVFKSRVTSTTPPTEVDGERMMTAPGPAMHDPDPTEREIKQPPSLFPPIAGESTEIGNITPSAGPPKRAMKDGEPDIKPVAKGQHEDFPKLTTTDYVLAQLQTSAISFVIPTKANIREQINAQLLIDPSKELVDLERELTVEGDITSAKVAISKVVKVTLVTTDFTISTDTPSEQVITDTQPTEWRWLLTPIKSGQLKVKVAVDAIIIIDNNRQASHHLRTFEKDITITITKLQTFDNWWNNNWQWAWAALIIPFLSIAWRKVFK